MAIFVGICPLIWRNLASPWSNDVVAVDASHWGLGATISTFSTDDVADLGRFSERWRFGVVINLQSLVQVLSVLTLQPTLRSLGRLSGPMPKTRHHRGLNH